jgi:hypothetical protein
MVLAAQVRHGIGIRVMSASATPLQQPTDAATQFQELLFFVRQRITKVQTATLVEVQAVTPPASGLVGTVDVLPLVGQIDGAGNVIPHKTLYGRPYSRVQGGTNAIIMDPAVGDQGVMVFASRDISSVVASGKPSPPASGRSYNYADGLYLYSLAKGTPTQYIQFLTSGINIKTVGNVNINGAIITPAGEIIDAAGKVLGTHDHQPGTYVAGSTPVTGNSGPPV